MHRRRASASRRRRSERRRGDHRRRRRREQHRRRTGRECLRRRRANRCGARHDRDRRAARVPARGTDRRRRACDRLRERTSHAGATQSGTGAAAVQMRLLARVDYLVVNETEAESLTGIAVHDDASAERAADALCAKGAGNALVTLGARGVCWRGRAGNGRRRALAVTAVDTTAAGDTFVGGFAAARAGGASMDDAIAFGQRAAAISVTRHGAQTSIPTRDEVACIAE
ncbi:Sugar kinase [Burkholderia dolosa AU0158]|nr:Sugar kinase [Burkholderia dolosa AU0158]